MKVYVIVGASLCSSGFEPSVSPYGVKSTLEKAQEELKVIKDEIIEDYESEYGDEYEDDELCYNLRESENGFSISFDNDDEYVYNIKVVEIDYEEVE